VRTGVSHLGEEKKKGTLYLCATPIGNLEDITIRVLKVLREVDVIAAEDTRHTQKLLNRYRIRTPVTSFHQHNRVKKGEYILKELGEGKDVALVTDAGTPGVSDPGEELVDEALAAGFKVVPLPGPSACITALAVSGLPAGEFFFAGFLPASRPARLKKLEELLEQRGTLIFYEAPHRLVQTLEDMRSVLGDRRAAVARELTKVHEEVVRGTLGELAQRWRTEKPRGEFTLVVDGAPCPVRKTGDFTDAEIFELARLVGELEAKGVERKEAIRTVARGCRVPRREVYRAVLAARGEKDAGE